MMRSLACGLISCFAALSGCTLEGDELPPLVEVTPVATHRECDAEEVLARQLAADPKLGEQIQAIDEATARFIKNPPLSATAGGVVIIPTVVHVLYRTASENISDAQIQSQIDVLNKDFRRTNSDANNLWSQAADTSIEFRLMGISRTATTKNGFGTNDSIKFAQQGGHDVYQPSSYMNIWVGNVGGGILGYAQFPGGSPSTDGVVIDYRYFGTIGTATAPFNLGRQTTHEVGHYLNLRHIWGDSSSCGVDDGVSDTPDSNQPNYGCPAHSSCGNGGDMVQNYMDYSDDSCMNLFTQGQKARMQALFSSGGARQGLVNAPLTPVDFGGGGGGGQPPAYQVVATYSNLAGVHGAMTSYGPFTAAGVNAIKFATSGGTGDVDLYVRFGAAPTQSSYDCRPYVTGNTENCEFNPAQQGNYYVMLHAYSAYANVTLTVSTATSTAPAEVCGDGIDNDGDSAIDCDDSSCAAACTVMVSSTDFNSGFGPYSDGGSNARLVSGSNCASGSCVELRASGVSASISSTVGLDFTAFSSLVIDFRFIAQSMEPSERFYVEMWNGSAWVVVGGFVSGSSFVNNTVYQASIPLTAASTPALFNTNARLRIRCSASAFDDLVYIDNLVLTGQL